jgi:hypothetical protein
MIDFLCAKQDVVAEVATLQALVQEVVQLAIVEELNLCGRSTAMEGHADVDNLLMENTGSYLLQPVALE